MSRRRIHDSALALALGFGLGTAVISANELRQQHATELLGQLDFFMFCSDKHGGASAVLADNDARGWRCMVTEPLFDLVEIDVDEASATTFGTASHARTTDPSSPYSWNCYRG